MGTPSVFLFHLESLSLRHPKPLTFLFCLNKLSYLPSQSWNLSSTQTTRNNQPIPMPITELINNNPSPCNPHQVSKPLLQPILPPQPLPATRNPNMAPNTSNLSSNSKQTLNRLSTKELLTRASKSELRLRILEIPNGYPARLIAAGSCAG